MNIHELEDLLQLKEELKEHPVNAKMIIFKNQLMSHARSTSYSDTHKLMKSFSEEFAYPNDFETRIEDWNQSSFVLNMHKGEVTLKYLIKVLQDKRWISVPL